MSALHSIVHRAAERGRIEHITTVTLVAAGLTLANLPARGVGGRVASRVASAALAGFITWVETRDAPPWQPRAGAIATALGATLATGEAFDALDARIHRSLVGRVRHPRLVMAIGSAALSAAAMAADTRTRHGVDELITDEPGELAETVEVPERVRAIATALLGSTGQWDADVLRHQLQHARAIESLGADPEAFYPSVEFQVAPDTPLAVPAETRFPIVGRYYPFDGRSADVTLTITAGRIAWLGISPGDDWTPEEYIDWAEAGGSVQDLPDWPDPAMLTLLHDTTEGLRPLHAHRS